ncbi:adenine deaminase C-terminal domain-containing protein [Cytobacillus sp. IB215665]|uniref:adenine deaminase C-terminal domain-containing protein n=1 Tax=Cytobacillus sp. IB215665 TaxID=3097357 RepID=UPI002A0AFC6F|nr:adenine deaminase C-terminal domain-containing protein [Cytobacillus sp. IB215665]MDX8365181.1 adenine deaminase C-terminal domain-containing protein [Cytobacillus sp. IB215665]
MPDQRYRWKNKHLREHVAVIDGTIPPTLVLTNAIYLNQVLNQWVKANIWIYYERIIYVGKELPSHIDQCEIVDCNGYYLVPGYIEPHAHPFQLYNPHSLAEYASQYGTTTLINDNMSLVLQLPTKQAFSFISHLKNIPSTLYWWCRFDPQTEIQDEELIFSHTTVKSWLEHDAVLQGGELTGWPKLLAGDDMMLLWIQEAKRLRKQIEGHFPGASEKTLAKMMLLGATSDHEAMTGDEVYTRLMQGYTTSLRYSSIRPDLPKLIDEIHALGINKYDHLFYTTDGSTPSFYKQGFIDNMINIAIDKGVPPIDAYNMATINVARYYQIEYLHGNIATGRVANINFLTEKDNATPVSVLAKGMWLKKDGRNTNNFGHFSWEEVDWPQLNMKWDLKWEDLQFSMPLGLRMENDVIMKPYSVNIDVSVDELSTSHDESFLMLVDRNGKWRLNTIIKGFTSNLLGMASSFSNTGDMILIGKKKADMLAAYTRMKEIGGGIVIAENNSTIFEIPLKLNGVMSLKPIAELIPQEQQFKLVLRERGYQYEDPVYSLLFLQSTHLPYVRITQQGIYDVMNKTVLFPTIIR